MLLKVENLVKEYGPQRVVDSVSFHVEPGEIVGLAGESGSGKSTIGQMVLNLIPHTGGTIHFDGLEWTKFPSHKKRSFRRRMQVVFQDPYSSLNPRLTVGETLSEPLKLHGMQEHPAFWLEQVSLPASFLNRYPRDLSGGQRQRVAIARALCTRPELLICDEPLSALDKFTQRQILALFESIHIAFRPAMLFISHDLSALQKLTTRLLILQRGVLVEAGATKELLSTPKHPYTQQLLAAHRTFYGSGY